jgi:hypothetical protein
MLQVGEAAGLIAVQINKVEDLYGNGGLLGDYRAAPNWLHRQSSSQHPAPFRDRMPAEQGQLLALHLDQIGGRLVQGADGCRLKRHERPTRAAIAATVRSMRANWLVPLGSCPLARRLRPSKSRPRAPKTAATGGKLSAYWTQTDGWALMASSGAGALPNICTSEA